MKTGLTNKHGLIAEIALAVPLRKVFDYRIPSHLNQHITCGVRVTVPFGKQKKTGLVIKTKSISSIDEKKIKSITHCIDEQPLISQSLFKLLLWVSDYYQAPLGEVVKLALPGIYEPKAIDKQLHYKLNQDQDFKVVSQSLSKAPKQKELFDYWIANWENLDAEQVSSFDLSWRRALKQLCQKDIVESEQSSLGWPDYEQLPQPALSLSASQQSVFDSLIVQLDGFNVALLKGVTGSGKTEIYLRLAL